MKTRVTEDGFVWLVVEDSATADAIFRAGKTELYHLYDDGTEGLIESGRELEEAFRSGLVGMEVGFVRDLLPCCPKCGGRLAPGRNPGYEWECSECDEDFKACEI